MVFGGRRCRSQQGFPEFGITPAAPLVRFRVVPQQVRKDLFHRGRYQQVRLLLLLSAGGAIPTGRYQDTSGSAAAVVVIVRSPEKDEIIEAAKDVRRWTDTAAVMLVRGFFFVVTVVVVVVVSGEQLRVADVRIIIVVVGGAPGEFVAESFRGAPATLGSPSIVQRASETTDGQTEETDHGQNLQEGAYGVDVVVRFDVVHRRCRSPSVSSYYSSY